MILVNKIAIPIILYSISVTAVYGNQDDELNSNEETNFHPPVVLQNEPTLINSAKDVVPDFASKPTITSKQNGNWFDLSTWQENRLPEANDVVRIEQGHTVNYNGVSDVSLAAIGIKGILTFDTEINTKIKAGTILVYSQGRLEIGTVSNPVKHNILAELIIANRPLAVLESDPVTDTYDPLQFGTGMIVFGEISMHGKEMTPTWARLAQEPKSGQTRLSLEVNPSGWSVGDKLVLPDTRQTPLIRKWQIDPVTPIELQLEELIITDISDKTITLSKPLDFDHLGGRDTDGNIVGMPHVGNLTRNIRISSEDPYGVRGHLLFTERANVDIRYTAFVDLGRTTSKPLDNTIIENGEVKHIGTNQIGRYPIHMHHLMGPVNPDNTGYQFVIMGNSVDNGAKWGITVHNSHFGLIDSNVVYDTEGASFITEEGNEKENRFTNNFAVKSGTIITSLYEPRYGGVAGTDRPLGFADFGYEGSAYWFTGNDNYLLGNVAANAAFAGVMYNSRPSGFWFNQPLTPKHRGADIDDLSQWTDYSGTWAPKVRISQENEIYASGVGLWVGFSGMVGKINNYLLWNIKQTGIYSQRNTFAVYADMTLVSDQTISNQNHIYTINKGVDLTNTRYRSGHTVLKNIRVEGFNLGIDLPAFLQPDKYSLQGDMPPKITIIENSYLRNYVNVREHSPIVSTKHTLINNVEFVQNTGPSNKYLSMTSADIISNLERSFSLTARTKESHLFVLNYNRQPGENFEYFFYEQSPDHVIEDVTINNKYANPEDDCPTLGMTNQQCWDKYGVATLNQIARCTNNYHSEIQGFTCPINDSAKLEELFIKRWD
ncbi:G8 domain-containing protein [Nitrosomonas marina]|uniref:G8 domain-containing protein n=1 Tax=Nitrosomonas marina TaxID=917 RepID=A0A1H8J2S4_9PROT|nr:G8 domain-containing protein [Nitrosomonas marina]SEN74507.1 G8 domain-containing protein [Nitrosomonas marina]